MLAGSRGGQRRFWLALEYSSHDWLLLPASQGTSALLGQVAGPRPCPGGPSPCNGGSVIQESLPMVLAPPHLPKVPACT